jgi:CHAT domain-containing protein
MARFLNRLLSIALGLSMVNIPIVVQADTYTRSVQAFTKGKVQTSNSSKADKLFMEGNRLLEKSKGEIEQRQALTKLYKALELFQSANNNELEQVALYWIVVIHNLLNDKTQTEKYIIKYNANILDRYNRYRTSSQAIRSHNDRFGNKSLGIYATYFQPRYYPRYNEQLLNNTIEKIKNADAKLLSEALEFLMPRTNDDYQQALVILQEALKLYQLEKNEDAGFKTLQSIAIAYKRLGNLQQPQSDISRYEILRRSQEEQAQAKIPNSPTARALLRAKVQKLIELGEYQQALNYANQLILISEGVEKELDCSLLGVIHSKLGSTQSIDVFNSQIFNDSSVKKILLPYKNMVSLISEGIKQYDLEEYKQALDYLHQAEAMNFQIYQQQFDSVCSPSNIQKMGRASCDTFKSSVKNPSLTGLMGEPSFIIYIGDAYKKLGDNYHANQYYQKALASAESRTESQDLYYANLSGMSDDSNSPTRKSASELIQLQKYFAKARNIGNVGRVYSKLLDNKKAIYYLNQAITIYQSKGNQVDQAELWSELSLIDRSEGKISQALTKIEKAIKIIENTRSTIISSDLRTSYFASVQKYYRLKIDLLMQLHQQDPSKGYDIRAIEASESARARGLLDLLIESKANIKQGVDPQLLVQERAIQSKLDAAEKRRINILNEKGTLPPDFEQEYNSLNQQYEQNKDQIRLKSPRYAAITQPKPLKFAQIQQLLDDKTVLLEYSLGETQSYLWLVTKNRIYSYQLPKSAEIKKIVDKYLPILTSKSGYTSTKIQIDKIAPQLKAILPDAVANKLANKRLVVVADGALQYLPFGSLPTGADNQPLLLTNEVINLPSASTLGILRAQNLRSQASKTVAVFADPVFTSDDERIAKIKLAKTNELTADSKSLQRAATENGIKFSRLVNTKNEAEAILKLVPLDRGKLNLDFAANLVNATNSDLANYRIVHFATHGIMDGLDPTRSGVVLSLFNEQGIAENGYLRLQNIFNLKLDADLVVLSACQTGIGKEIQGEGLVGLTRGFMYAGTPRVVVSLWSVDDEATSILMSNFYTGILKQGLTPAAALRQAQQTMMRDPKYQSPYYWAAFTLQGEWK